jgi:hypothetical protein
MKVFLVASNFNSQQNSKRKELSTEKTLKIATKLFFIAGRAQSIIQGQLIKSTTPRFVNEVQRTCLLFGTCLTNAHPHVLINILHSTTTMSRPMDATCSPWHVRRNALVLDRLEKRNKNKMKHGKQEG